MAVGSSTRISRLAAALQESGVDAFFAWSPITMKYLAGFGESGHERFLTFAIKADGETAMICPALSEQQVRRAGVTNIRSWQDSEDPLALFQDLIDEWNLRSSILAVDDDMSARQLLQMQTALPAALFKAGQPVLSTLMRKKDPEELNTMFKAAKIADDAYAAGLKTIKPGTKESEVSCALSGEMRRLGGAPTFSIIGAGANGAEPHHLTDNTTIKEGDVVVMDFGCDVDGYQSDITRCACCGKAPGDAKRVYDVVLRAHMAARSKIRPGIQAQEIDGAARDVITAAGYAEFFVHRTGHGIGMRGHEEPYIVQGNETILEVGDCFSIEPGIYLPGRFGIRIENIVTVTAGGHESQNEEPADILVEIT
jgi:Xaa-Pro dipeptidase